MDSGQWSVCRKPRSQGRALVHQHCPVSSLLGLVCYNEAMKAQLEQQLQQAGVSLPVEVRPGWYF
ncbi:DarT ssDNA thymidine ADP-ribosyltransferase family protein [Parathalassolituus penaei]|uniref:DarT ssDNA thymidine ADP-ribosyltransferase family protein n=1 Tax=Parathalassolituus penaei TaxID=2997323 RepID=UPI003D16CD9B